MTKKIDISRRQFLQKSALLTAASTAGAPFALDLFRMNLAAAATAGLTDYKALVCIYLNGGNDHNNMVLATDLVSKQAYLRARDTRPTDGAASIALLRPSTPADPDPMLDGFPTLNVLPITPFTTQIDRTFGLHPAMAHMRTLFNARRAAIVANVGPLTERLLSAQAYRTSLNNPSNLFSHSDQTAQWQTSQPNPLSGWGGRVAEQIIDNNSPSGKKFTCMSASGNTMFLAGNNVNQYQINPDGTVISIQGVLDTSFGVPASTLQSVITPSPTPSNLFESDHAAVVQRSIDARQNITDALAASTGVPVIPVTGETAYINPQQPNQPDPNGNPLARQLRTVARIISQNSLLGAQRQIFFVRLGDFDTHNNQAVAHAELMSRLAHGMRYFDTELTRQGLGNSVTTFTASDFGRTFSSNGDGTDHGWGAHHFVVGGAVKGGDIYGVFPPTGVASASPATVNGFDYPAVTNPLDVGSGSTVPQVSVDQYAATMAKWFGLSDSDIQTVFPNLHKFTPNFLGFYNPPPPLVL